jgi:hydroxymethylglutaryl-CoA reductase
MLMLQNQVSTLAYLTKIENGIFTFWLEIPRFRNRWRTYHLTLSEVIIEMLKNPSAKELMKVVAAVTGLAQKTFAALRSLTINVFRWDGHMKCI